MNTLPRFAQEVSTDRLRIGELAEATGVAAATLRVWESRHGFPRARRDGNGRRHYTAADVTLVRDVVRRQSTGLRLAVAIRQALAPAGPVPAAVYPELTRAHPELPRQRLRVSSLLGLSWAIEDEVAASGERGHLFGSFQTRRSFESARERWTELARTSASTHVFADFETAARAPAADRITLVALAPEAPMLREWTIVHDSPELPVALVASELPGQGPTAPRDRLFESVWTLDPAAVRAAARSCAAVAAGVGGSAGGAADLVDTLAAEPGAAPTFRTVSQLAHRVVASVEEAARS